MKRHKLAQVLQRLFPLVDRKDNEKLDLDTDSEEHRPAGLSEESLEEWQTY